MADDGEVFKALADPTTNGGMMRVPVMTATIERRLLVNYRVEAEVVARLLPEPFRPVTLGGWAVAGICLIRLSGLRPSAAPGRVGFTTENAAHRIAVQWDTDQGVAHGVFVPRRDTSSRLTTLAGGRQLPCRGSRRPLRGRHGQPGRRCERGRRGGAGRRPAA